MGGLQSSAKSHSCLCGSSCDVHVGPSQLHYPRSTQLQATSACIVATKLLHVQSVLSERQFDLLATAGDCADYWQNKSGAAGGRGRASTGQGNARGGSCVHTRLCSADAHAARSEQLGVGKRIPGTPSAAPSLLHPLLHPAAPSAAPCCILCCILCCTLCCPCARVVLRGCVVVLAVVNPHRCRQGSATSVQTPRLNTMCC